MASDSSLKKILLVDDNPLFLKMLSQAFKKSGFVCDTSESAADALQKLKTERPDAIVSDYQMPVMNGLEFRRHLLKQPVLQDIPFIFLTDFSDEDLVTSGLNLQAIDYVLKNTPVNVIVSKLNNLIDTVSKQRQLSEAEVKKAATALNIKSIPQQAPILKGYELNFWHQSFQDIPGGDFIDFIQVTDRFTFIVLGDVMGKKWMAWFLSFSFLSYIRAAVKFAIWSGEYSTAAILQKVNHIIATDEVLADILSSLSLLMIDHEKNTISYSGAGDLPIVYYEAATGRLTELQSSGLLLGLFADGMYEEQQMAMQANDQLFIFTDGIIDYAVDKDHSKSDYKYFVQKLKEITDKQDTFANLKDYLKKNAVTAQVDDCSIIHLLKTTDND